MKKHLFVLMLMTAALLPRGGRAQANGAAVLVNIQRRMTWRTPIDSVQQLAGVLDQLRAQKPNPYLSYWVRLRSTTCISATARTSSGLK